MSARAPTSLLVCALLACLAPTAPAQAVDAGQPAPDFGGEWFNHPSARLSRLRGRVAYLEFWGPGMSDFDRDRIGGLRRLGRMFGERGLVVLVLTTESKETIEARIEDWWIDFIVVRLDDRSVEESYGVKSSYPQSALVDNQGRLEWRGSSFDLDEERVAFLCKDASIIPRLPAEFDRINQHLSFGSLSLGKAHEALDKELRRAPDSEPLQRAFTDLRAIFDAELGRCDGLASKRDFGAAHEALERLQTSWVGSKLADEAKARRTELLRSAEAKSDIKAWRQFTKAQEAQRIRKYDDARKLYESIVRNYPGTRCAERSEKALGTLERG